MENNKEILIKRLALIKYLCKMGIEQSRRPGPGAAFSILTLHDSIEMFLKLLTEHHNIKSEKLSFMEYWVKIPSLTLKESMRNLNARRVNIKHKGLLPSKEDVEISRVNTIDFFNQNTKAQFGLSFNEISLLTLVSNKEVREHLEKSQLMLDEDKKSDSIELSAIGFHILIDSYENSKLGYYSSSPFNFSKNLAFLDASGIGVERNYDKGRQLADFIDNVKESIENIQDALKIISLGIDYKKFAKFDILTPIVRKTIGGLHFAQIYGPRKWTQENCQFCIDFVLECSLKLQEFDFDIKEVMDKPSGITLRDDSLF